MEDEKNHPGGTARPQDGRQEGRPVIDQRQQQHDPARHDTTDSNAEDAEGSTKQPGLRRDDLLRDLDNPVNEPGP